MPQPLGGVFSLIKVATKYGLAPDPAKALQKPHDERLKRVTPWFMCKPGPPVDTRDVVVAGRDGPIPARVYTRPGTRPGAPAILFIHGGAFIDLGVDFCDTVQRGLGVPHVFQAYYPILDEAAAALDRAGQFLSARLASAERVTVHDRSLT